MGMRRYWLFGSVDYYASGGMCDFRGSFDDQASAAAAGEDMFRPHRLRLAGDSVEWWHVFDTVECKIIAESESPPYGFTGYPEFRGAVT